MMAFCCLQLCFRVRKNVFGHLSRFLTFIYRARLQTTGSWRGVSRRKLCVALYQLAGIQGTFLMSINDTPNTLTKYREL